MHVPLLAVEAANGNHRGVLVFLDDVLVYLTTLAEHATLLRDHAVASS